ncbi:glycerophosphodiester phosphodiesterase [Flavihumibacter sp. UBA7668]|uniref:glycerophosphodiester phosphodiesterase n=1 Tax=Flavihumibacter sp. UBA7668 TaxID=1946542 RepID=UPI0025C1A244|nr:glycerophosphodiester phosphodiesterase family protein [Flavihumibacter sp. UBA7668]
MKTGIIILVTFFSAMIVTAQSVQTGLAGLSNYRYAGKATIGELINGRYENVRVTGSSDFFFWKNNQLVLTKKGQQEIKSRNELMVELDFLRNGQKEQKKFRILNNRFHKNQVIAHRGAWKKLATTENSLAALAQAVKLGCAGSEFDVHYTKDDSLIINHDAHFNGKAIEDFRYAELAVDLLSNGEVLPTLRAYLLSGMNQYGTQLIVEIKPTDKGPERAASRARKTVELVHELGAQAWVSYISFDYSILLEVKKMDPAAHVQFLSGNKSPDELLKDGITGLDYHLSVFQKNENWIKQAKMNKMMLNVWTVNDEKNLRYFLAHQFPMITTNEPELLFELIKASPSASQ